MNGVVDDDLQYFGRRGRGENEKQQSSEKAGTNA